MTQLPPVIMLFARAPILGTVKQRLARDVGAPAALEAHCRLVDHALASMDSLTAEPCLREIWVTDQPELPSVQAWAERWQARLREQVGQDLGASMRHALHAHIRTGRSAVVVGSDVPSVDAALVLQAFEALQRCDVVVAPSEDGGYGLIGASRTVDALFSEMPWGTDRVMNETRERARAAGFSVVELAMQWDVDTLADLHRFEKRFE